MRFHFPWIVVMAVLWPGTNLLGQTTPPPSVANGAEAAFEPVFKPYRDWWYRGAKIPDPASEAANRFERHLSAHPDDPEGLYWAAILQGVRTAPTKRNSVELLEASAAKGYRAAMARFGSMLMTGEGIPADRERGQKLLEQSLADGEPDAAVELGLLSLNGRGGFPVDRDKARKLFQEAARLGTIRAHYHLARLEIDAGNDEVALQEFRKGATAGDIRCMEKLAEVYRDGRLGQAVDPRQAVEWMQKGAEHASKAMQRELAKVLAHGKWGVVPDQATARRLIELAAGARDPEAMLMLARGHVAGKYGFPKDVAKAGKLLGELVDMNYPPGMYTLARLYLDRMVVPNNMTPNEAINRANTLMKRAAEMGYPPAKQYIAGVRES